jgi:hypothetical protein
MLPALTNAPALHLPPLGLPGLCPITAAVEALALEPDAAVRGAVNTRPEVVGLMLDALGYTPDQPLHQGRLLEPSFGSGEFLLAAAQRLLGAAAGVPAPQLRGAIRAVELHQATFVATRAKLLALLAQQGLGDAGARMLADAWLVHGDFLLSEVHTGGSAATATFDWVVGNPPYVRQELIAPPLLAEYRRRYSTLYDRADLYVPFIERALGLLAPGGRLAFICADRWMKNRYGGPLRALVARHYHLQAVVDMVHADAFEQEVSAYPAITLLARAPAGSTLVAQQPVLAAEALAPLAACLRSGLPDARLGVHQLQDVVRGDAPWVLHQAPLEALLRRLEARWPTLEQAGCKVGIGVATGADKVFIGDWASLPVEPSRKLPLATTADLASGELRWRGAGVINPFEDDGRLVDLAQYPLLQAYLAQHQAVVAARHVAKKNPAQWYRTIDRITPALARQPKLLVPDIKGNAQVVLDEGQLYPHHNLYVITADTWDLRCLQAVLLSRVARTFVASYATTLRGGYLRFQAQYLRRICLPHWAEVPPPLRQQLQAAALSRDPNACDAAAAQLYGLSADDMALMTPTTP